MRRFIKMLKNSLTGKILKVLFKILLWALEILIVFLALVIVTQRVTGDQKAFLGFRIYNVATGSMEPEYAVGDILISKEKDPSLIEVGDNIVYMGKSGGYAGKIITHSVIEIERNEKGEYLFHTKGKANTVEDPVVHEEQLYGTIVQNNHFLAFICKILTNRYGLYFFVVMPIIIYAFIEFVKIQGRRIQEEREAKEKRKLQAERRAGKGHRRPAPRPRPKVQEEEEIFEEEIIEEDIIEEELEDQVQEPEKKPAARKAKKAKKEETSDKIEKTNTKSNKKEKTTAEPKTSNKEEKAKSKKAKEK